MNNQLSILLSKDQLSEVVCQEFVSVPEAGGIVVFIGTVRNQTQGKEVKRLEFEGYEPMAMAEMTEIGNSILEKFKALRVAIHHRIGVLSVGEIPVIIAISCPHRKLAFEACEYAIDTLKESVPIWKKEIFLDGEVWVSAHP